ncbi:hypothetical protein FEE95_00190 [Maribacter algarum]|uniref:Zinc-binding metallo-peptidase n=1 Tax=Maribacter algarum (ex Zhang et al. 2020) TaxID=2578118 RepID=A0A5S3PX96_9FLAO|nr:putative zinc-binding metallopeptidase [Maribacter algarum]TMM57887.1 hypothetical protein FEE95_00190 [Maribacter algarum]
MKTTRKLVGLAMVYTIMLSINSCDYYEPPELPIEQENTSEFSDNSSEPKTSNQEDKITLYQVEGEDIIKIQDYEVEGELIEFQNDIAKHQELWELVKKIIPPDYRSKMSQFLIYHGEKTKTSGFVDPTINNLSKWQFAIAIDYAYEKGFDFEDDLVFTIIHEFGHILTLNNEQLTAGVIPNNCTNYYVNKGCSKANSYISTFYNSFWLDIEEEFNALEETIAAKSSFYTKYSDRFISEYAATSPREDIAEVFATFVVQSDVETRNSVVGQKIQLMYEFPELTELRKRIRENNILP